MPSTIEEHIQALSQEDFLRIYKTLPSRQRKDRALRFRFRTHRDEFLKWCFPAMFYLPFNAYHRHSLSEPKAVWTDRVPRVHRLAVAAPRGIAKTTLSKGEMLHDVAYSLEGFTIVMSADLKGARKITKHMYRIFKDKTNEYNRLYGPFDLVGGIDEYSVVSPSGWKTSFTPRSFGTEVRGAEVDAQRPTKVVIDDGEQTNRVRNPVQRAQWWDFLHEDILKLGPKEGGLLIDWRGTVLHPDSVLANLLKTPGWSGSLWQSITAWPTNKDLWTQCGRVWKDLTNPQREDAAEEFYREHKEEMDEGAEVLDPVAEPIYKLYTQIWGEGMSSFLKEKQNEPRMGGSSVFDTNTFERFRIADGVIYTDDGRKTPVRDLRVVMFLDPIPGKDMGTLGEDAGAGGSDYAGLAVVGKDKHGYSYVLDVWMKRAKDSEQIAAIWHYGEMWHAETITIESNGFQRFFGRDFRRTRAERKATGKFWKINVNEERAKGNKEDRIASMEPAINNGWTKFNEQIDRAVMAQFEDFPTGGHDDGIDAIEGAIRCSPSAKMGGNVRVF